MKTTGHEPEEERLVELEIEMNRLSVRIAELRKALSDQDVFGTLPRENGAVRRATMDLTRALAKYRRPY